MESKRGRGAKCAFILLWFAVIPGVGLSACLRARTPPPASLSATPSPQNSPQNAILTSGPSHLPTLSHHRIRFAEVGASAGLRYRFSLPGPRPLNILQTMGNGCAFLDYDKDGNLDILLVGDPLALYRGNGRGQFSDVTHKTGLDKLRGHFFGVAVGDYDNDGFDDLYISGYQTGALLHNQQGRRFEDVTQKMSIPPQPWGTSCTFADLDGDGFLDLYVCNYVRFGPTDPQLCDASNGVKAACHPNFYKSLSGQAFRNRAGTGFEPVTAAWFGIQQTGNALGVASADFDGSGRPGLALANDGLNGDLFQNQGGGRLNNIALASGAARDAKGKAHAGMGIDWGDYDNDGRLDLFVTTFVSEPKCLYRNEGDGLFQDVSATTGLEPILHPYVSFGCKFLDADNDGWLDIIVASGHVEDNIAVSSQGKQSYRQPIELLRNTGASPIAFQRVTDSAGLNKLSPIVGRGLATGDYDNDGKIDVLVVDSEGVPLLLHNETTSKGTGNREQGTEKERNWLTVDLTGRGKSNRDAYGAMVTATLTDGQRRVARCQTDGSYLSASDRRIHFGLGDEKAKSVTALWPDGRVERWENPPVNRFVSLREGTGIPSASRP